VEKKSRGSTPTLPKMNDINRFIRSPQDSARPLWCELDKHQDQRRSGYPRSALGRSRPHPAPFPPGSGLRRLLGSCNPATSSDSISASYFADPLKILPDKRITDSSSASHFLPQIRSAAGI